MCSCDESYGALVDSKHGKIYSSPNVVFKTTNVVGMNYKRPLGRPGKYVNRHIDTSSDEMCQSEQITLSLGYDLGSVVVKFANPSLDVESKLYYSTQKEALFQNNTNDLSPTTVEGSFRAYSEIYYIYSFALTPPMGTPYTTTAEVLEMEDTRFDIFFINVCILDLAPVIGPTITRQTNIMPTTKK